MIRRSTVVYITILLVLAGIYYSMKNREQTANVPATTEPAGEVNYLFKEKEGDPNGILIEARSGEIVEVARNTENAWTVIQPFEAMAEQATSEEAANQIRQMRILERIPEMDPEVVGLAEPQYVLTVRFKSGTERRVNIGVVTPTESGYYVQDASGEDVLIVSKSAVELLLRLLYAPPVLETPTPGPIPSVTPTPSLP